MRMIVTAGLMLLVSFGAARDTMANESGPKEETRKAGQAVKTAGKATGEAGKHAGKATAKVARKGALAVKKVFTGKGDDGETGK
jgi:hypothetical protein